MNYGYFDKKNKEYVITRPDTPSPWANYLGDPNYGAIISNNAAGYSFEKSGANGRILRYRFNSTSNDLPGRYIYIRDDEIDTLFKVKGYVRPCLLYEGNRIWIVCRLRSPFQYVFFNLILKH